MATGSLSRYFDCPKIGTFRLHRLPGKPYNVPLSEDDLTFPMVEGAPTPDNPHPIQEAFVEEGAVQCGFCIPGMVLSSKALLDKNISPTLEDIKEGLSGNLCRCTGYTKIFEAVEKSANTIMASASLKLLAIAVHNSNNEEKDKWLSVALDCAKAMNPEARSDFLERLESHLRWTGGDELITRVQKQRERESVN